MPQQGCLCRCTAAPVLGTDRLCASGRGCESHRIIEWPGLKRTTVIISFQPPAMCRVANQQTRLPRATSSLALNASRDGAPQPPWATCSNASPPSVGKTSS